MYQADIQLTSSFDAWNTSHKLTYGFQGDLTESSYTLEETNYLTGVTKKNAELGSAMSPTFADSD
ncbi:MAG: hypothetical protein IK089_00935, partial [Oxalobacter sp.]|nr:hypothetical protein [Oxalobacter sp.]